MALKSSRTLVSVLSRYRSRLRLCNSISVSTGTFIKNGKNTFNNNLQITQFSSHNNHRHKNKSKTPILINSGILTYLGLRKEEPEEDPLIHTIKLGILSMQKEEYNAAEQYLHLALRMSQERSDPQATAYVYDILANVAFQKGDFAKAEILFIEVMKHLISTGKAENDNAIVEISLKMAAMFSKQGLSDKAETGFEFCINTQQKKLDQMDNKLVDTSSTEQMSELEMDTMMLWAMSIDWYARHLLSRGKLKEAQTYFEKAFAVSEKVNGESHHQTLVLMNDIGSVATLRANYSTAIAYLQSAIERGKLSQSPDLSAFYCNLGATYLKKGDQALAFSSCSQALSLGRKQGHGEAIHDATGCLEELKKMGFQP